MKKSLIPALLLSAGLFSACTVTGPSNLRVHEALLYGGAQERIVWVYGSLTGGSAGSLKLGGQTVELRAQIEDAVAVPGSLSVGGKATFRQPTGTITVPLSVTRRADGTFDVVSPGGLSAVYYTDGQNWSKLGGQSGTVPSGTVPSGTVRASAVSGLQGAGQLTADEAGVLSAALLGQGPLAVGVLSGVPTADAPLAVDPKPGEYRRTALYVLPNVATVAGQPLTPAPSTQNTPSNQNTGARVNFTELASGTQSGAAALEVRAATTPAAAAALYAQAYARQTGAPAAPDPGTSTLVGVFLGQRSTGGYGVKVTGASASGGTLSLVAQVRAPGAGSITTQALTSPWTIVRVDGKYQSVNVVDEQGQPLR